MQELVELFYSVINWLSAFSIKSYNNSFSYLLQEHSKNNAYNGHMKKYVAMEPNMDQHSVQAVSCVCSCVCAHVWQNFSATSKWKKFALGSIVLSRKQPSFSCNLCTCVVLVPQVFFLARMRKGAMKTLKSVPWWEFLFYIYRKDVQ